MNTGSWLRGERALAMTGGGLLLLLTLAYANHFNNDFAFDDAHTILSNAYIRDPGNIPRFFTDATTVSTNPANQMYRPLLTTLFALDYQLAGGTLGPLWFHVDTFFWYLLQLVLMFFLFRHLFEQALPHRWNGVVALLASAFYGFHTANAETINYISARSDSLSTMWLVAAFVVYLQWPQLRRYGLYLLPLLLGLLVKQAVLVFPALLFLYALLFEGQGTREDFAARRLADVFLRVALPSLVLCGLYFIFQAAMTPDTFTPGGGSRYAYLITQPAVALHYLANFLLPVQLVADTDWTPLTSMLSAKFVAGVAFVTVMLALAWITAQRRAWRPVTFGILWFFVALAPSSSLIPFAEVLNDHRTFFPYVGLAAALAWALALYVYRADAEQPLPPLARQLALALCGVVIGAHAVGVQARNDVWHSGETLWRDVTEKAPGNGRGWMNYGVALMARGDYDGAERAFRAALERWPQYSYIHINLGVLSAARGNPVEAEPFFAQARSLEPGDPQPHFFYGKFLADQGRVAEAVAALEASLAVSPGHLPTTELLPRAYVDLSLTEHRAGRHGAAVQAAQKSLALAGDNALRVAARNNICIGQVMLGNFEEGAAACQEALALDAGHALAQNNLALARSLRAQAASHLAAVEREPSAANQRALSLFYYRQGIFTRAAEAARAAVQADPADAESWNNLCASQNNLGAYAEGIEACERALTLRPRFALARNNLAWARAMQARR